ncbi:DEAD/DEAH box helicase [Aeromicrobium sp. Leaf350]|uniref:DEAD/DEAH box helicase n=1 Tax=Aeromicrobium sp. Leaf350 TaxID=2876565 RepID=UPI001E2D2767|nr:DEAD/DEAH box helicase [Aeromicrobium sp. Leaf350]
MPAGPVSATPTRPSSPAEQVTGFSGLGLPKPLVKALAREGIVEPTPIQQAVLPAALAGKNVLGRARTGSGKTLSFGIPVLDTLAGGQRRPKAPRGLILVPTRELASQIERVLAPMATALHLRTMTILGGMPIGRQAARLREGVDLVVATPGRLTDLIARGAATLDDLEIIVLDEADHLCDLGFFKPVDALLAATPRSAQRLLLSATLDGDVDKLVKRHLPEHVLHDVETSDVEEGEMTHHLVVTDRTEKMQVVRDLLLNTPRTIVFARTRRGAARVARQLTQGGIEAVDLHGDLDQRKRDRNLARFSSGDAQVIVATDIAARGIHVDDVPLVLHFDAPAEHKAYTHRSGRTARAGESGTVVTMTTPEDQRDVIQLQRKAGVSARQHRRQDLASPLTVESLATTGRPGDSADAATGGSGGGRGAGSGGGSRPGHGSGGRRRGGRGGAQGQGGQGQRPRSQGQGSGQGQRSRGQGGQSGHGQSRPAGGRSRDTSR